MEPRREEMEPRREENLLENCDAATIFRLRSHENKLPRQQKMMKIGFKMMKRNFNMKKAKA